jgi:hypothetical protein
MLPYKVGETGCLISGASAALLGFQMKNPIFVVGTGRCGTSLLAQILKSHPQLVTFPGEANHLWHPKVYPYNRRAVETPPILGDAAKFTRISIENWPRKHENKIRNILNGYHLLRGPSKVCILKSAMISFMIPQLLELFPGTKFLHIYRSGPSVVESLVLKEWDKHKDYYQDKADFRTVCARYWNDCILEIEKQRVELALDQKYGLLEFSYEQLCEDPPAILDRLASFLGFECGEFAFDVSRITSQNFKAGDYYHNMAWIDPLSAMSGAMALKGYAVPV